MNICNVVRSNSFPFACEYYNGNTVSNRYTHSIRNVAVEAEVIVLQNRL